MIKKLSIVFAALLAVMSIHAQDEKPRHEIGVSYGLGVSLIGDGIGNAIGTGIFEIGFSGYKWFFCNLVEKYMLQYKFVFQ